jgi:hypothetical protein
MTEKTLPNSMRAIGPKADGRLAPVAVDSVTSTV